MHVHCAKNYLDGLDSHQAIQSLKSLPYYSQHRALTRFGAKIDDDENCDGFTALACAAYGWMPTILKSCDPSRFNQDSPISKVRSVSTREEGAHLIDVMDDEAPVNNSWVGTSKFIHFLNPDMFPIWDSRVAKCFGMNWPNQYNKKLAYSSYFNFIHDEIGAGHDWIDAVAMHIATKHGYFPSAVRCIELVLFERPETNNPNAVSPPLTELTS